jgi:hypothetical protein
VAKMARINALRLIQCSFARVEGEFRFRGRERIRMRQKAKLVRVCDTTENYLYRLKISKFRRLQKNGRDAMLE